MSYLADMHRVLRQHQWSTVEEWVESFRGLAMLSDEDIGRMCENTPQTDDNEL